MNRINNLLGYAQNNGKSLVTNTRNDMIGAIIGAGSDLISNIFGASNQRRQIAAQKELAEYQFQKNVEMWNMQNEYNAPSAQMQRLKAAGLNPNLVYGNGSVTGNTTSNAPQYQAPNIEYNYKPDISGFLNVLGAFQNYKKTEAEIDKLNQEISESKTRQGQIDSQRILNGVLGGLYGSQKDLNVINSEYRNWELSRGKSFEPYQLESLILGNKQAQENINKTIEQTATIIAEREKIPYQKALMVAQAGYYKQAARNQGMQAFFNYERGRDMKYQNDFYGQYGFSRDPGMYGYILQNTRNGAELISNGLSGIWNFFKPNGTGDGLLRTYISDPAQAAFTKLINWVSDGINNMKLPTPNTGGHR